MRTSALIAFVVVAVISVSAAPIPKSQAQARSPGLAGIALKVGEEAGPEILNLGEDVFHHFFGSSDDSSQTQPAVSADPTAAASASRRMVGVRSPSLFNLGEDVVKDVAPSLIKAVPEIVHLGDDVFNHFAGSSSDDQSSAAATSATASVLRSRQVHPIGPLPRALLLGPGIKLPFGLPLGPGLEIPNLTPPSPGVPPVSVDPIPSPTVSSSLSVQSSTPAATDDQTDDQQASAPEDIQDATLQTSSAASGVVSTRRRHVLTERQAVQIAEAAGALLPGLIHSIADGSAENDVKEGIDKLKSIFRA